VRRAAAGAAVALAGAGLALGVPASAAPVDVSGMFGGFRASAVWTFPPDTPRSAQTFAFAEVYQPVTSLNGSGIAVVGVGACVFVHDADRERQCTGSGFTHELVAGELQLSPTLANAKIDYFERGNGYHVTWSATDVVPTATPSYGMSASAVAVGGRIARNAEAHGTVIGLDLDQADRQAAVMSRGGSFGATFQPVEGRVDVRFRLPAR
jgi:hypothetical protein